MGFGRVITAMVTPFDEKGEVRLDKAQELACHLLANGSDSILVAGTTGEGPTLTENETFELFSAVKEAVGSKGAVIGGVSSNSTARLLSAIEHYNKLALDGYLTAAPYYNKPSQEGIYRHIKAAHDASAVPIVVYNIPGRCGVNIDPSTMVRLAELPRIVAMKESTGNVEQISELIKRLPKDFSVYSGDDYMTFPIVAMGGAGVVSVASHLVGKEIREMVERTVSGDLAGARDLHLRLTPMFRGLFKAGNPVSVKTALNLCGFDMGGFRLPLCEAGETDIAFLRHLLKDYGLN